MQTLSCYRQPPDPCPLSRAQHSSRVEEVRKLEAANRELCEEQKGLSAELAAVKCRLETKDHQCKNAEMKYAMNP